MTRKPQFATALIFVLSTILFAGPTVTSYAQGTSFVAYPDAVKAYETGRPIFVFVSGRNCSWCQELAAQLLATKIPQHVVVAKVDKDKNPEDARRLMGGATSIPFIVVYYRDSNGRPKHRRMIGKPNSQQLQELLNVQPATKTN